MSGITATQKENLLQAALEITCDCGWKVFPVKPREKIPLTEHGCKDATNNEETIVTWGEKWPDANIGIATGQASGIVVLDVDKRHGGDDSLFELEQKHGELPKTVEVITGGGGRHIYFKYPSGDVTVKNAAGLAGIAGLDIRGDGGYVVAPPSVHESGQRYAWEVSCHPGDVPLADMPAWLLKLVTERERKKAPPVGEVIREGERNATLTSLAGSMRRRGMSEDAICKALQIENRAKCKPPLSDQEIKRIAGSAGKWTPKEVKGKRGLQGTELENAERLVSLHGADLRYCHPWKLWLVWDGRRWKKDATAEARRRAVDTVRSIYGEAEAAENEKERGDLSKWARRSESDKQIHAMLSLATAEPGIPVLPEQLDSNPWLLNCQNGTVDLRTGELREHRPEDLITKLAPIPFEPMLAEMQGGRWDTFLEQMIPDPEVRAFLKRAVGYTLTGDTSEEVLFFVHGPAAAGKSTFAEAVKAALGDYATTADFETFLRRRAVGAPRQDIARLAGARLVASIEVGEGRRLAEGLVKMLTGGDTVTARFLHSREFEFLPDFKLWLVANRKPEVKDGDAALWRRILLVPFTVSIPEPERNPKVKADLRDPEIGGPAVLAWAVQGCLEWQREGLRPPSAVKAATQAYRIEMDPLEGFIEDRCIVDPGAQATVKDLYQAYKDWCDRNGEKPLSKRSVGVHLADRGFKKGQQTTGGRARFWEGIGLQAV